MNPSQKLPFARVFAALGNSSGGKNAIRGLLSRFLSPKDSSTPDPTDNPSAPLADSEPPAPAPKVAPTPEVLYLPKGLATELRKAVNPTRPGIDLSKPEPPAPAKPALSTPRVRLPSKMVHLPKEMLSVLRKKAPEPLQKPLPGGKSPRSIHPETRFRGKDFPII